jgi:hypothetical protein
LLAFSIVEWIRKIVSFSAVEVKIRYEFDDLWKVKRLRKVKRGDLSSCKLFSEYSGDDGKRNTKERGNNLTNIGAVVLLVESGILIEKGQQRQLPSRLMNSLGLLVLGLFVKETRRLIDSLHEVDIIIE